MKLEMLKGNAIDVMKDMKAQSVDMVISQIPHGTPVDKNAPSIPLEALWAQLKRICRPTAAICLFGNEPFQSIVRTSNIQMFQYDWIWEKAYPGNFVAVGYQPLKFHEIISVFGTDRVKYFPIKESKITVGLKRIKGSFGERDAINYVVANMEATDNGRHPEELRNPSAIQFFNNRVNGKRLYAEQKPMELYEYLLKTHSQVGDVVLDFAAKTGDVGAACHKLSRGFIGIESTEGFYRTAKMRLASLSLE